MLVSIGQPSKLAPIVSWAVCWRIVPLRFRRPKFEFWFGNFSRSQRLTPHSHYPVFYIGLQAPKKKEKKKRGPNKCGRQVDTTRIWTVYLDTELQHIDIKNTYQRKPLRHCLFVKSVEPHGRFSVGSSSPSWELAESQDWHRNMNHVSEKGVRVWSRGSQFCSWWATFLQTSDITLLQLTCL